MRGESGKKKGFSFSLFRRAFLYLTKNARGLLSMTLVVAILDSIFPYIGIILSSEILNQLADPGRSMEHLFFLALLLVGLNFFTGRLWGLCAQILEVMRYTAMKHIDQTMAEKAWQMDYAMSADPKINATKERISSWHYDTGVLALSGQLQNLFQAVVTIGISVTLVVELIGAKTSGEGRLAVFLDHPASSAAFFLLLAGSILYGLIVSARLQHIYYQADEEMGKYTNKQYSLLEKCVAEYHNGKDIRMFRAQGLIGEKLRGLADSLAEQFMGVSRKARKAAFAPQLFSKGFDLIVYLFVGLKAMCGAFGVGSILKYTGMVNQLSRGVALLPDTVLDFLHNFEYLHVFFDYLDMPNLTAAGQLPVTEQMREDYEFEFQNVTFTYPNAASPSLYGVSCRLKRGEKIAIVGRNGSGKTTFIKLLCRLCDPQEGRILLNGMDIRQLKYEEYLELFSTVFQDYQIFAFQLGENVAAESEYEEERAKKALQDAGFGERLESLEKGLHTQLFQHFSEKGVELSGGESQKVAIARCLYKDAPYVVMDEPTAALDPVAEADIYQRMNSFTRDKGAVYISHRLSSCYFCDRIFVFDQGRIVEEGSHEELLKKGGLYRKLWDAQAKYYA